MSNSFPTASTVINRLKGLGIDEAYPGYKFSDFPGYYVLSGLAHTFGPTIQVQSSDAANLTRLLGTLLDENGWNVEQTHPNRIRVNSIPRKSSR